MMIPTGKVYFDRCVATF